MAGKIRTSTVADVQGTYRAVRPVFAKSARAPNTKITGLAGLATADRFAGSLVRWPRKIEEASPTEEEIEACLNSLEHGLCDGCESMSERLGNGYKTVAPVKDRPSISFTFLWGLVAVTAACFWWLARIILEAMN